MRRSAEYMKVTLVKEKATWRIQRMSRRFTGKRKWRNNCLLHELRDYKNGLLSSSQLDLPTGLGLGQRFWGQYSKHAGCRWMRPLMILQQPFGAGTKPWTRPWLLCWRQVEACWSSSSSRSLIILQSWEEESCPSDEANRNTLFTVYHFGQLFLLNFSIITLYMSEMGLDPIFPPPVTTSDILSRGSEPDALMQR